MALTVGAPAPEFTLKDQSQQEVKLSDFRGKKRVVLVFYPLDWSPVCTKEHACFADDQKRFEGLDAQVLGLSVDSVWSHKAYAEKMGIQLPAAGGLPSAGGGCGQVRSLSGRQGNHGTGYLYYRPRGQAGLAEELRHSGRA